MKRLQWIIITFMISSCASELLPIEGDKNSSIEFMKSAGRIPIVKVLLNDKPAWFIIDTGASVSVLHEREAESYGFEVHASAETEVTGFTGKSNMRRVANCTLRMSALKISHIRFNCKDINELVATVYRNENIKISGILGSDVFTQYRMQIDFMNQTISF